MQISEDSSGDIPAPAAPGRIDPAAMTVAQAAKVLSTVGNGPITEEMIRRHIEAGAPTTADDRINLVHYAAWLNQASSAKADFALAIRHEEPGRPDLSRRSSEGTEPDGD